MSAEVVPQEVIHTRWGWLMAYALLVFIVGIVVLLHPLGASILTMGVLGVLFTVFGVSAIASGFSNFRGGARWVEILFGLLAIVAGVGTVLFPLGTAVSLFIFLGVWLLVGGVIELIHALKTKEMMGWRLLVGSVDLLLGIYIVSRPAETTLLGAVALIALAVSVSLLLRSMMLFSIALLLRRWQKAA